MRPTIPRVITTSRITAPTPIQPIPSIMPLPISGAPAACGLRAQTASSASSDESI